ncbi:MAG: ankyrin repeat domain-containing protein [Herminiimonas sp.]|nr:ankyrin repeat domain-containing protein [Herminiimonas sp.]
MSVGDQPSRLKRNAVLPRTSSYHPPSPTEVSPTSAPVPAVTVAPSLAPSDRVAAADAAARSQGDRARVQRLWDVPIKSLLARCGFAVPWGHSGFSSTDEREIRIALETLDLTSNDGLDTWPRLHAACVSGDAHTFDAVLALVRYQVVDPNQHSPDGDTLLHSTIRYGASYNEGMKLPMDQFVSVKARIDLLLLQGADANQPDLQGLLPLQMAWERVPAESESMVTTLLLGGCNPAHADAQGHSLLHRAARDGDLDVIRAWCSAGLPLDSHNEKMSGFQPPLMLAWENETPAGRQAAALLLAAHCNPLQQDEQGETMLHCAARTGNLAVLRGWGAAGLDPQPRSYPMAATPLMVAAEADQADSIDVLINEIGANPDVCSAQQMTALHWAVRSRSLAATRTLLDAGVDIHAHTDLGMSALHMVVEDIYSVRGLQMAVWGLADVPGSHIRDLLLQHGADWNARFPPLNRSAQEFQDDLIEENANLLMIFTGV